MDHHRHLESLLDSALATLTLIRENTTQTQNFTPHLLEVLRVLNHRILPLPSTTLPTTIPTMTAATTVPSSAPTVPATYASAAQRPESPSTSENNTVKQSGLSRPSPSPSSSPALRDTTDHIIPEKKLPTRVIIRFDQQIAAGRPRPNRTSPIELTLAIDAALRSHFYGNRDQAASHFASN
ncbi:hypothetical protein DFH07DRAFT_764881 [Mycena maculata]|uniref:Uncharacterized protein n=1 Tax=Mycena maculata TaxID=230809 RepID=A0AAD7NZW1_9AGAR|nr:hypothetical protein DFH07DRAFT_764881 [Mycena maculata]